MSARGANCYVEAMRLAGSLIAMSLLAACTAAGAPATVLHAVPQAQEPPALASLPQPVPQVVRPVTARCGSDAGVVTGVVSDERSRALPGVTVVATSPTIASAQTAITDDAGWYRLQLPEGTYLTTFYYLDYTIAHVDVPVHAGCVTPSFERIDTRTPGRRGETIRISPRFSGAASRRVPCPCTLI